MPSPILLVVVVGTVLGALEIVFFWWLGERDDSRRATSPDRKER
ncbi:MAG: hypothetical protein ACRDK8_13700 [Solirubrobacteraceae bacterium]